MWPVLDTNNAMSHQFDFSHHAIYKPQKYLLLYVKPTVREAG